MECRSNIKQRYSRHDRCDKQNPGIGCYPEGIGALPLRDLRYDNRIDCTVVDISYRCNFTDQSTIAHGSGVRLSRPRRPHANVALGICPVNSHPFQSRRCPNCRRHVSPARTHVTRGLSHIPQEWAQIEGASETWCTHPGLTDNTTGRLPANER
jgi:hypothetical protein